MRLALAEQRVDMVLTLLGLTGCQDTIVGNATSRGVRYVCPCVRPPLYVSVSLLVRFVWLSGCPPVCVPVFICLSTLCQSPRRLVD